MGWIEAVPLPALRVDGRGRVAEVNRLAAKLFRKSAASLRGRSRARLAPPSAAKGRGAATRTALVPIEVPLARGVLLLYSDRSVVDELQQQVYHLSRLASAGRLVAVVVHEINNALSGILGYAQLLLARTLPAEIRRDLQSIHAEAQRTARVAQNLLRFSRSGKGEKTVVALPLLLQRCVELKRRDFTLKSIVVELDVESDLPPVLADDALLTQVFVNLLTNAQQSISGVRERGRIRVVARLVRRKVVVDVEDDGPGISPELRERVFDPFFTSRHDGSGTGLGLTLCREILRDHDADVVVVRKKSPGARLRVSLPIAETLVATERTTAVAAAAAPIANRHVVIVEDEPSLRDLLARLFSGHGNHVSTFEHAEDALQWLAVDQADLIVSDVLRPGLDGIGFHEQLARTRPALLRRILFVTGDALSGETSAFLRRSKARVLQKPFSLDDVLREARAIVEEPDRQGELFERATRQTAAAAAASGERSLEAGR